MKTRAQFVNANNILTNKKHCERHPLPPSTPPAHLHVRLQRAVGTASKEIEAKRLGPRTASRGGLSKPYLAVPLVD